VGGTISLEATTLQDNRAVTNALDLDLAAALRLATRYSRTLQSKREGLYLQGLATLAAAREFGPQVAGTVDYVLRHAPCRVVIASDAAAPGTTQSDALGAALSGAVGRADRAPQAPPDA
jgi:hypothetical protein